MADSETWSPMPRDLECWDGLELSGVPPLPKYVTELENQDLIIAFKDLQQLSNLLNIGLVSHKNLSAAEIQNQICSAQYRL